MLEFLIGGCGGNEETFLVTGNVLEYVPVALVEYGKVPQVGIHTQQSVCRRFWFQQWWRGRWG